MPMPEHRLRWANSRSVGEEEEVYEQVREYGISAGDYKGNPIERTQQCNCNYITSAVGEPASRHLDP